MIDLRIDTDDEQKREIIQQYWALDPDGSFSTSMKSIKAEFGLSRGAIVGIVRSESTALSRIHQCQCGKKKEFDSRADFRSTPKMTSYSCAEHDGEESPASHSQDRASQDNTSRDNAAQETPTQKTSERLEREQSSLPRLFEGDTSEENSPEESSPGKDSSEESESSGRPSAGEEGRPPADTRADRRLKKACRALSEAGRHLSALARELDDQSSR
jgi:flagellar biosynthesis GTPase FlhF